MKKAQTGLKKRILAGLAAVALQINLLPTGLMFPMRTFAAEQIQVTDIHDTADIRYYHSEKTLTLNGLTEGEEYTLTLSDDAGTVSVWSPIGDENGQAQVLWTPDKEGEYHLSLCDAQDAALVLVETDYTVNTNRYALNLPPEISVVYGEQVQPSALVTEYGQAADQYVQNLVWTIDDQEIAYWDASTQSMVAVSAGTTNAQVELNLGNVAVAQGQTAIHVSKATPVLNVPAQVEYGGKWEISGPAYLAGATVTLRRAFPSKSLKGEFVQREQDSCAAVDISGLETGTYNFHLTVPASETYDAISTDVQLQVVNADQSKETGFSAESVDLVYGQDTIGAELNRDDDTHVTYTITEADAAAPGNKTQFNGVTVNSDGTLHVAWEKVQFENPVRVWAVVEKDNYNPVTDSYLVNLQKATAAFSFEQQQIVLTYGDADVTNRVAFSNQDGVQFELEYSSSAPDKVSVDPVSGKITALDVAQGVVISAKSKENDFYQETTQTFTVNVEPRTLQLEGAVAQDREYNRTVYVALQWNQAALVGILDQDDVALAPDQLPVEGSVRSMSVGTYPVVVDVSQIQLQGADAGKYDLTGVLKDTQVTISRCSVSIDPQSLQIKDKKYDGSLSAEFAAAPMLEEAAVLNGDEVELAWNQQPVFDEEAANIDSIHGKQDIAVSLPTFTLTGKDSGNYELEQPEKVTGSILATDQPVYGQQYDVSMKPSGEDEDGRLWYKGNQEVYLEPCDGYVFWDAETKKPVADSRILLVDKDTQEGKHEISFYVQNTETGEVLQQATVLYGVDSKAPSAQVNVIGDGWFEQITGWLFNKTQNETTVKLENIQFGASGRVSVKYTVVEDAAKLQQILAMSDADMQLDELNFDQDYVDETGVVLKTTDSISQVVFQLKSRTGTSYYTSDGLVRDTTAPVGKAEVLPAPEAKYAAVGDQDWYNQSYTVKFTVQEANFVAAESQQSKWDISNNIVITANKDGEKYLLDDVHWTVAGENLFEAVIEVQEDGLYTFELTGSDIAGNELAAMTESVLAVQAGVDTTAPEFEKVCYGQTLLQKTWNFITGSESGTLQFYFKETGSGLDQENMQLTLHQYVGDTFANGTTSSVTYDQQNIAVKKLSDDTFMLSIEVNGNLRANMEYAIADAVQNAADTEGTNGVYLVVDNAVADDVQVKATLSTTNWTNSAVTLTMEGADVTSGVKEYAYQAVPEGKEPQDNNWTTKGLSIESSAAEGYNPFNITRAELNIDQTQCMDYYVRVTTGAGLQKVVYAGTVRIVRPEDAPATTDDQVQLISTNRDQTDKDIIWTNKKDGLRVLTASDTEIELGATSCPVYTVITLTDEQGTRQVFVNSASSGEIAENLSETCLSLVEGKEVQQVEGRWNSNIQQDGAYQAQVVLVDAAGNTVDAGSVSFTLDTVAPVLQFVTEPSEATNHETFFNQPRSITLQVKDAYLVETEMDIVSLERQAEDNGILPTVDRNFNQKDGMAEYTMVYEADGQYALMASYTDRAGNKANVAEVKQFVIDRTRPIAEATYSEAANVVDNVRYYNAAQNIQYTISVTEHNFCMLSDGDVQLVVRRDGQPIDSGFDVSEWQKDGDVYTKVVTIVPDSENHSTDGTYEIELNCTDAAGNTLEQPLVSTEMVMDTTAPVITRLEYDQPYVENSGYYYAQQDTQVVVTVNDRYLESVSAASLTTTDITQSQEPTLCELEAKEWVKNGDINQVQYMLDCDQDDLRTLQMVIRDNAGNSAVLDDALVLKDTPASLRENVLTIALVVDKTNPVLESVEYYLDAACTQPVNWNVYQNTYYAANTVYVKYTVREHNLKNVADVVLQSKPVSGEDVTNLELQAKAWQRDAEDPDLYSLVYAVPSFQDDMNMLQLTIQDRAQREALAGSGCALTEGLDSFASGSVVSCFVVDITDPVFVLKYDNNEAQNGKYFDRSRTATLQLTEHNITLEELNSPDSAYMFVTPVSNNGNLVENDWVQVGVDQYEKTVVFGRVQREGKGENEDDGKFQLRASEDVEIPQVYDFARRMRQIEPESGTVAPFDFVVDGHNPVPGSQTEIAITLPQDYADQIEVDGRKVPLYSQATQARIEVFDPTHNDTYSGIESVHWKIEAKDLDMVKEGDFELKQGQQTLDVILPVDAAFNSNRVKITIYARDMAGRDYSESVWLAVDVTAPIVSVSYDNNSAENDRYFKADRTATITVIERNFDPKLVQLDTTGASSGWSKTQGTGNGDNTVWTMTVGFATEGVHSLQVTASDLAGHKAGATAYSGVAPNDFVLDKTAPAATLAFDNNDVQNGKYYKAARVATVTVEDVNFNGMNDIVVSGAEKAFAFSGNTATVYFDTDGVYSFQGTVTDLAGNVSQPITCEEFVIDLTEPELMISGVEDRSANPEPVNIVLSMTDTNLDLNAIVATLTGTNNGAVDISGKRTYIDGGVQYVLDTIDVDDYYQLVFTGTDLAGNSVEKTVSFSENQNGTVFEFLYPELLNKYTNKPFRPAVMLHDVDEVTVLAVTLNGKQVAYDYADNVVTLKDEINTDGKYTLTIDTVDAAKHNNTMDVVEFYFDSVAPILTVEGVENGGYYFNAFDITLRMDNSRDFYSVLELDGKQLKENDYTVNADGSITIHVDDFAEHVLKVQLQDEAGNTSELQEIQFVLTNNLLIRWYRTKPVFYGTIVAVVLAISWWLIMGRKKKQPVAAQRSANTN